MPLYTYKCWGCDSSKEVFRRAQKPPKRVKCPGCGKRIEQDYTAKFVNPDVFNPYVEDNFFNLPIEVNSKEQRETLCDNMQVTYDRGLYSRKAPRIPWDRGLTWQIAQHKAREE